MNEFNPLDAMQLSLLDTGLTTEQIEKAQQLITEAGVEMWNNLFARFAEEGFTDKQIAAVTVNLLGFMVKDEHMETMKPFTDQFLEQEEE